MVSGKSMATGVSVLALAAVLTTTPIGFDLGAGIGLHPTYAFAKDGENDDSGRGGDDRGGDRDDDDRDDDDRDDDDRDDDNSGPGGGGDDDGDRGDDDDDRDDDGGRGGDDDDNRDDDDDDRDDDGRGGDDDDAHDDRGRGRGRGGDDGPTRGAAAGGGGGAPSSGDGLRVVKLEESAAGFEVIYSNGVKEEIENGRYEMKNAAGRTVVERRATAADLQRIRANARNSGVAAPGLPAAGTPGGEVRSVEVAGRAIEVRYVTGWKEELEAGRYELKDPNDNTVVERPATAEDQARLTAIAGR